jgi:homoserine O-succinyltransferase
MPLVLARSDVRAGMGRQIAPAQAGDAGVIEIGVLNNLSDAGLEGGDRQIVELLRETAGPQMVRLHFFSLPSIARGPAGQAHIAAHYSDFSHLFATKLDGLFVTGCEPCQARLPEEAFWPHLTEVMDWAEHNTRSTIWSCLAAHAAVLHFDGIERRRLPDKRTGLFRVVQQGAHPLLAGADPDLRVPHSRYNDIAAEDLEAAGYQILTRSPEAGVDTFIKSWRSLFVYLQGHPEYDGDALRREYRRDVIRFLDGTSETYPRMPMDYFDAATAVRLDAFESRARKRRTKALIEDFPLVRRGSADRSAWQRDLATTLFSNWLTYLRAKTSNRAA